MGGCVFRGTVGSGLEVGQLIMEGRGRGGGGHWGPDENISPEVGITVFHAWLLQTISFYVKSKIPFLCTK